MRFLKEKEPPQKIKAKESTRDYRQLKKYKAKFSQNNTF